MARPSGRLYKGLSPRVRGNQSAAIVPYSKERSIPASAGEPIDTIDAIAVMAVYPRECGGTDGAITEMSVIDGLSPRVRGNHTVEAPSAPKSGSIPASAGEPLPGWTKPLTRTVYPRECGGTVLNIWLGNATKGLSPRVRGNRAQGGPISSDAGSIPASAGEPSRSFSFCSMPRVYPRECGGTLAAASGKLEYVGLSPRVRGNPIVTAQKEMDGRSIPASAGEPRVECKVHRLQTVYPRECGGTRTNRTHTDSRRGLSPRVRGNRSRSNRSHSRIRSIPASAGEPAWMDASISGYPVYPRECGGTSTWRWSMLVKCGLGNTDLRQLLC